MNFYAGKIIKKKKVSDIKKAVSQIITQKEFNDNPKIVSVKDYFEDYKNIYIILELCKNKSLADYLYKRGGRLTEIEVKCFIFQLLQGLQCLHKKEIIHRDLKPSNLLLDDKYELKIGDFSKIAERGKRRYSICGTYNYMAPEIFENNGKGYSFEVDIWSVGIIMYELLTGKLPFNGENNDEIRKNILSFQPKNLDVSGLSKLAADLIIQILEKEPKKRPGINQIIYHYFFHDIEFPKYINPEILSKIGAEEREKTKEKKSDEKIKKLHLYNLIVDDIPKIEYENIKNYVIKESDHVFEHYIKYCRILLNYNFCYFEFNNEIIGIIFNFNEEDNINMIYNTETELFYHIKINENNKDDDEIEKYTKKDIPDELEKNVEIFLNYYQFLLNKKENYESNEQDRSIEEQISFSSQSSEISSLSNENSIISQNQNIVLDKSNLIYVRKIITKKEAIILFLSDETVESIFKDNVKILISESKDKIEIIKRNNKINAISVSKIFENSNYYLVNRIKYIKHAIFEDIKKTFY